MRASRSARPVVVVSLTLALSCAPPPVEDTGAEEMEVATNVWGTEGGTLNVRERPTTASRVVASLAADADVDVGCQIAGEPIRGNPVWNYVPAHGGYAADAFLWTGFDGFSPNIPRCEASAPQAPAPSSSDGPGYMLPLACGSRARVSQGNGSSFSHSGAAQYGFDFGLERGTTLHAVEAGTVALVRGDVRPGDPCYSGGGFECRNTVNYVVIGHDDGTDSAYLHVDAALVIRGQRVKRGDPVALSGGTGWSTGPHAHVQRQLRCGSWWCQSIAMRFVDVAGGAPVTGQTVTSGNCP